MDFLKMDIKHVFLHQHTIIIYSKDKYKGLYSSV